MLSVLMLSFSSLFISFNVEPKEKHNIVWHWEDEFSASEKEKLEKWVINTLNSVESRIGIYPFPIHLYMKKERDANEPVPWAHTWRYPTQQVHFFVDPSFSYDEFMADWTAPHELSHLAIPYIGEKDAWFAEGFASFMQYQVMEEMKIYTDEEIVIRYEGKINKALPYYDNKKSMAEIARELREAKKYPAMYWGGACFFLAWNDQLIHTSGKSLTELFPEYLTCCRLRDRGVKDVVSSLDKVSGLEIGQNILDMYYNQTSKECSIYLDELLLKD